MALRFKKALVTGAAGFIGSSLVDRLLSLGVQVSGIDNFSTGQERFLEGALKHPAFKLRRGDLLDAAALAEAALGCDFVFHLAANADVRFGLAHPERDLQQNTVATFRVLEAARQAGAQGIAFSSTGSVYGEPTVHPTPEDAPFPVQTSLYGASKVAGEGLLQAYAEGFGMKAYIFRFVSILGERYTHGHVFDFYKKLKADPSRLPVLGNGLQRKSYLYVGDCLDAILTVVEKADAKVNIYNLGTDEFCQVNDSIGWINAALKLSPKLEYSGGERGWVGDSPFIFLDTKKMRSLGWAPKRSIREGIISTVAWLQANDWVFDAPMRLQGRVVAVTGASRGLGLAIAEACAREGAQLLMGARDQAALKAAVARVRVAAPQAKVEAVALDVAEPASAQAFADAAQSYFGRADILVNNAGIHGPKGGIADVDWGEWEAAMRVNLFGCIHCCRSFLPLLRRAARGKIINLSGGGATQPVPFLSAYAASKAALVRFTETLAKEEPGLDVNAVAPGAMNTRLLDDLLAAGADKLGQAHYDKLRQQQAQGGTPVSVAADMIAWLASAESDGISGRLLSAVWDNWKGLPGRLAELAEGDVYTLRRIVPADRGKDWGEPK